jgi:hypothetical protein
MLIILIINIVIGISCAMVNSQIIATSFALTAFFALLFFTPIKKTLKTYSYKINIVLGVLIIFGLVLITLCQSPEYSYDSAQKIIINDLNDKNIEANPVETEVKKIRTSESLNCFINHGYLFLFNIAEEDVYYFFDPVSGDYDVIEDFQA